MYTQVISILKKDIRSELRTRYAVSAIILFVFTAIIMTAFSLVGESIDDGVNAGLLWVIMFFGSMTGLVKSFVSEEERGTALLLKLNAPAGPVYLGKLLFNVFLSLFLNFLTVLFFFLFSPGIEVVEPIVFITTIFLGSIGLASGTTILSAIISRANTRNALFPVLSFPILLPLILIGIETTEYSFSGHGSLNPVDNYFVMIAYSGIVITASFFLFELIWRD